MSPEPDEWEDDVDETTFAQGRKDDRTYASRSFPLERTASDDAGTPARFICKVFDPVEETMIERRGEEWVIRSTPAGRYQFKLLVAREAGNLKDLWIQRVPAPGQNGAVKNLLHLPQRSGACAAAAGFDGRRPRSTASLSENLMIWWRFVMVFAASGPLRRLPAMRRRR